jgi:hypothetical protein
MYLIQSLQMVLLNPVQFKVLGQIIDEERADDHLWSVVEGVGTGGVRRGGG